jgi:DMSO/TMAO reductase YedYZ molybdopterin-dependent catalytic subunit
MKELSEYQGQPLSSINDSHENAIKDPQRVDIQKYRLAVTGLVTHPLILTYNEAITHYRNIQKVLRLDCVEGWGVTILWEGILLKDLLRPAGVKPETKTVIFHCVDGYSTSLPLDYLLKSDALLAHKANGLTLPPERGFPFHLVAESKWGYKWARWVTSLEPTDRTDYRGYWEKRGYSNAGDLDKEFFEL